MQQSETKFQIRIIPNGSQFGMIRIDSDRKFDLDNEKNVPINFAKIELFSISKPKVPNLLPAQLLNNK